MGTLPTGELLRIARLHGATAVRVFGSWARGDLLRCSVDVVTERSLSPFLRERVLAEAIALAA